MQRTEHGGDVGGVGESGQRRPGEHGIPRIERFDPVIQRTPPLHRVGEVGGLGAAELGNQRRVGPAMAAMDRQDRGIAEHGGGSWTVLWGSVAQESAEWDSSRP